MTARLSVVFLLAGAAAVLPASDAHALPHCSMCQPITPCSFPCYTSPGQYATCGFFHPDTCTTNFADDFEVLYPTCEVELPEPSGAVTATPATAFDRVVTWFGSLD